MRAGLTIVFCLLACLLHGQAPTEVQYNTLHGRVKTISEHSYAAKKHSGEIVKGRPRREYGYERDYEITYDSTGNKLRKVVYNRKGVVTTITTYTYDSHGFMIKERWTDAEGKLMDSTTIANQYNVSGQIVKRTVQYPGKSIPTEFWYQHDAVGNIYESMIISQDTPVRDRNTRRFTKDWRVTTWWTYLADGRPDMKHIYTYDEHGWLTADSAYAGWTKLAIVYKWKYSEEGTLARYEVCNPTGLNCEAWIYMHEYDKMGNWISVTEYRNGKAVFIKERTITYY